MIIALESELVVPQAPLRAAITNAYRCDEAQSVGELMRRIDWPPRSRCQAQEQARKLIAAVRGKRIRSFGVDALLHEFSLSSQEGIALMCLAEALLRIPDQQTADDLIRQDKQGQLGRTPRAQLVAVRKCGGLGSARHGQTGVHAR